MLKLSKLATTYNSLKIFVDISLSKNKILKCTVKFKILLYNTTLIFKDTYLKKVTRFFKINDKMARILSDDPDNPVCHH